MKWDERRFHPVRQQRHHHVRLHADADSLDHAARPAISGAASAVVNELTPDALKAGVEQAEDAGGDLAARIPKMCRRWGRRNIPI